MKKIALVFLTFLLAFSLFGCDLAIRSLPKYQSKSFYTSGGVQDFTDYAKYTYDSVTSRDLAASKYFSAVTAEDVEEILLYIENFEDWVEVIGGELKENYDFDKSRVSEGNYFYIKTKEGEPTQNGDVTYSKFANYTLYYFDLDAQVLYYFHNKT